MELGGWVVGLWTVGTVTLAAASASLGRGVHRRHGPSRR